MNKLDILITIVFLMAFLGIRLFIQDSVKSALDDYFKNKNDDTKNTNKTT